MKGHSIPFAARLITVCDVYAALRENRPYRAGMTHEAAVEVMLKGDVSGNTRPGMFDPTLLDAFLRHQTILAHAIAHLLIWPSLPLTDEL
jgi:putative two-component system response regulator